MAGQGHPAVTEVLRSRHMSEEGHLLSSLEKHTT